MIRINLLPVKEAQRAAGRQRQMLLMALCGCLAVLVLLVPYGLQARRMSRLSHDIKSIQSELVHLNKQTKEVRDLDAKRAELRAKLLVIDELQQKRVGPARVLHDLAAATPEKLWLVEFNESGGGVTITGMALDNQTIATFMRQLANSPYFYAVDLVETAHTEQLRQTSTVTDPTAGFKKFIVKARTDYTGQGGKNAAPEEGENPPANGKRSPRRGA